MLAHKTKRLKKHFKRHDFQTVMTMSFFSKDKKGSGKKGTSSADEVSSAKTYMKDAHKFNIHFEDDHGFDMDQKLNDS